MSPSYPTLVLVFVFLGQMDKDKHTGTHKHGFKKENSELSVRSQLRRLLTRAKQGGELHPCQSLQAVGRCFVRWDNEHLALPPPATLRYTSAHSGTLQHCSTLTLTH